jgi:predicted RNA polymerase sigma factor
VTDTPTIVGLLREATPQALAIVARRYTPFADCEDAIQEAVTAALRTWPETGVPDRPVGWLVRVASRHLMGRYRSDSARRRRERIAASWALDPPDPAPDRDDMLTLLFMCCHEALTPGAAIPLTLRAVGGLTTREIADAFLVKEATMAQRISRAKATIRSSPEPFALPGPDAYPERLRSVLHVLYLMFNEAHTASAGSELGRPDLAAEAIRIARMVRDARPDDPEVAGLLALMLLTDARRDARTGPEGELIPLAEQDRQRWDRTTIREGVALITSALRRHRPGEYQLQAAIAAVHDQAPSYDDTNWDEILALYNVLDRISTNPIITLNRAVATTMIAGPDAGLEILDGVADALPDHHRYHAVRAHLLERAERTADALAEYDLAIRRVTNLRERTYLQLRAAALRSGRPSTTDRSVPPLI